MPNIKTQNSQGPLTNDPLSGRPETITELLHDSGQAHQRQVLTTAEVCERPYWTRTAINTFLKPDHIERWRYYGVGSGKRYLYSVGQIEAVESTPDFANWKAKKLKRDNQAELRRIHSTENAAQERDKARIATEELMASYEMQYSLTNPVPDLARTLFELNRFAKHPTCSLRDRDHIYDLKHDVMSFLYCDGYSTDCYLHTTILPAKSCFTCDGWGYVCEQFKCAVCHGTGLYLPAKQLVFVVFHFLIGEERYCWHTPKELITFQYQITKEPAEYNLSEELKPVNLPTKSKSIELLEWFVSRKRMTREAAPNGVMRDGESGDAAGGAIANGDGQPALMEVSR